MKQIKFILAVIFTMLLQTSFSQSINWKNLQPSQKHTLNLNLGFDNATVVGIGYGYHLNTGIPVLLNLEYCMPLGDKTFDDLKTKIGAQANLIQTGNFFTTIKAYGVIRRFENDFARMINFGSEFSATAGINKRNWFLAGDFGFDKAIITHLKHTELMKEYNPSVQSGWYIPNGGNFLYGLQAGYSFSRNDVYAKIGNTIAQDLKTRSIIPYYFQLGITRRL